MGWMNTSFLAELREDFYHLRSRFIHPLGYRRVVDAVELSGTVRSSEVDLATLDRYLIPRSNGPEQFHNHVQLLSPTGI